MLTNVKQVPDFSMIFGAPGTGKTTIAVCIAKKAMKRGIEVYTNFPMTGAYKFDFSDIGKYSFENCLCLCDEAGIEASNREWKSIPKDAIDYLKKARHRKNKWVFLSQGYDDADKKIRGLCTAFYRLKKIGPVTVCREVRKSVDVDKETHQIMDMFYKVPVVGKGLSLVWRPRWYKYFDSWEAEPLPVAPRLPW